MMTARTPDLEHTARPRLAPQIVLFWILALALPVVLLFTMQIWMETTYTRGLFHPQGFEDMYTTGIFRYRVLGRVLLLKSYALLLHVLPHRPYPTPGDQEADLPFVLAYAFLNGICFLCANFVALSLLWTRRKGFRLEVLPLYFFVVLLTSLSMAVVTPYDQLAYFLLLLAVVGARTRNAFISYGLVLVSAVAGTLNRETEFLGTALLAALALFSTQERARHLRRLAVVHLAGCLSVYIGLRISFAGEPAISNALTWGGKWAGPAGVLVVCLFAAALVLAYMIFPSPGPAVAFMLFSLPYLITVMLTGALRELRLLVPLLLCLLFLYETLARWSTAKLHADLC